MANNLDEDQARWPVRANRNGAAGKKEIAMRLGISVRWVQRLCVKYGNMPPPVRDSLSRTHGTSQSKPAGPQGTVCGPVQLCRKQARSAVRLEKIIEARIGTHIPRRTIRKVLKDEELTENQPAKARQRKWIRYERRYSNSSWRTDFKQLPDGRWFVCYMDDASRFIVSFGVFGEATTANAIKVLEDGIQKHGRPAGVPTDHGSQFYANEKNLLLAPV